MSVMPTVDGLNILPIVTIQPEDVLVIDIISYGLVCECSFEIYTLLIFSSSMGSMYYVFAHIVISSS